MSLKSNTILQLATTGEKENVCTSSERLATARGEALHDARTPPPVQFVDSPRQKRVAMSQQFSYPEPLTICPFNHLISSPLLGRVKDRTRGISLETNAFRPMPLFAEYYVDGVPNLALAKLREGLAFHLPDSDVWSGCFQQPKARVAIFGHPRYFGTIGAA